MTFLFNATVVSFLKFIIAVLVLMIFQRVQHEVLTNFSEKFSVGNVTIQQIGIICCACLCSVMAIAIYAIYQAAITIENSINLFIMCF